MLRKINVIQNLFLRFESDETGFYDYDKSILSYYNYSEAVAIYIFTKKLCKPVPAK